MANHPNRSKRVRTFYMWQPHIGTITVFRGYAENMPREVGDRWQAIPTYNNRTPVPSLFTDSLPALIAAERAVCPGLPSGSHRHLDAALIDDGDEFRWDMTEGCWRRINSDGTFAD